MLTKETVRRLVMAKVRPGANPAEVEMAAHEIANRVVDIHDKRTTELLQYNNEMLQRARDAEAKAAHFLARPMRSVMTGFQPAIYLIGCIAVAAALLLESGHASCRELRRYEQAVIIVGWPITLFLVSVTNQIKPQTSICDRIVAWRVSQ